MRLSKSQFIRGLQCPKSLWLFKYRPKLRTKPDANLLARFQSGTEAGEIAQQLFPGGETIIFDYKKIPANIRKTQELIRSGVQTIYEATFLYDDVLVMVDILHRGSDGWELYEVKSTTSVKDVHVNDVGIQHYVVSGSGLDVTTTALVHINNEYTRQGELDVGSLFTIEPLTNITLQKQTTIKEQLHLLKEKVTPGSQVPQRDVGLCCFDPYECDFMEYCWQHIKEPSVFSLTRMKKEKKFELYYQGIISFDQLLPDIELTEAQKLQVDAEQYDRKQVDKQKIEEFLSVLEKPIGFLDFETFTQAIPQFDDQRPYQQIPFQYSLHVQKDDDLEHYYYLAESGIDPRLEFTKKLLNDTADCETILVYNLSFERRILQDLEEFFPEYADGLQGIIYRLVDLMTVFQKKHYYVKEMNGSYSIKYVYPALTGSTGYDQLNISDGSMAMIAFRALQNMTDPEEIEKTRNDLLEYCKLDTYSMVEILKKLEGITA